MDCGGGNVQMLPCSHHYILDIITTLYLWFPIQAVQYGLFKWNSNAPFGASEHTTALPEACHISFCPQKRIDYSNGGTL